MTASISKKTVQAIGRLLPVLWEDEHYVAFHKPPRIDLESPVRKRGPSIVKTVVGLTADGDVELLPLVLPERFSSGLALFAKSSDAAQRFAGMATSNKLRYVHAAVVKGNPPRAKIAVKPGLTRGARTSPKRPAPVLPNARVEILGSRDDYHLARLSGTAAGFETVRICFKAAGLSIVGDVRPNPHAVQHRTPRNRRPLTHLESLNFPHPFGPKTVEIVDPIPKALQNYVISRHLLEEHLHTALVARLDCLLDDQTNCHRLFTGRNEGISGLVVDKFASVVVLETLQGKFEGGDPVVRQVANWYAKMLGIQTVYGRFAPKTRDQLGAAPDDASPVQVLKGDETAEVVVTENGVKFIIKPGDGLATGLFMDHRLNRKRIASLAAGRSVLNLFAYTCGFSVAAAVGGASSTTNVDLSVANLEWGKRNLAANGIDPDGHVFIRGDAFDFFKRALRQGKTYDVMILDPPSFARTKKPKRTFEIKKNLVDLIGAALPLLNPGGHMLVATNNRQLPLNWLIEQVEIAAGSRNHRVIAKPQLPTDFAADPSVQKTIIVEFA